MSTLPELPTTEPSEETTSRPPNILSVWSKHQRCFSSLCCSTFHLPRFVTQILSQLLMNTCVVLFFRLHSGKSQSPLWSSQRPACFCKRPSCDSRSNQTRRHVLTTKSQSLFPLRINSALTRLTMHLKQANFFAIFEVFFEDAAQLKPPTSW